MGRTTAILVLMLAAVSCGGEEQRPVTTTRPISSPLDDGSTRSDAAGNLSPTIERVDLEPASPGVGETVRAVAKASDPEGDTLRFRYEWTLDGEVAGTGPTLSLVGTRRGSEIDVTVRALDGSSESAPAFGSARIANRAPVLKGIQVDPARAISPGQDVVVTADGEDPDGDSVSYRYTWSVNGVRSGETGSRFPTHDLERGDTVSVRVEATDGQKLSRSLESPAIPVGGGAPRIVSKPAAPGLDGVFRYQLHAQHPDGDRNLRYHLERGPNGMTVTPLGGEVQWAPRPDQAGTHPIELVVEDSNGARSAQRFELIIDAPPAAPGL